MSVSITTIDLLRHGECIDGQCYRGSSDVALSHIGLKQMQESVSLLINNKHGQAVPWQRIVSSPLIRCFDFSKQLSDKNNLPLSTEPGFKEMHFGEWEGKNIESVWQSQTEAVNAWIANPITSPPPAGEAADIFSARVISAFEKLIKESEDDHFLLVSHGGVMRVLLAHCLAMPLLELNRFDIPYACLSRMQVVNDQGMLYYRLLLHNVGGLC